MRVLFYTESTVANNVTINDKIVLLVVHLISNKFLEKGFNGANKVETKTLLFFPKG